MKTPIRTHQHALNVLRRARWVDAKGWRYELKAANAHAHHGSYTGHERLAAKFAEEAATLFLAVEDFLTRGGS